MENLARTENHSIHEAEEAGEHQLTARIKNLLDWQPAGSEPESKYTDGDILERETHSKEGEHVFVDYNEHLTSGEAPQCFVQVLGAGHSRKNPKMLERYSWNVYQNPEELYPSKVDRISELLDLFEG